MCIAAPGKIIEVNNDTASVDYGGNRINASCAIIDVKKGDWVLVHAGLIIQKLEKNEAENMLELFEELENL